ncbi:amidohydrolase family protein [Streptomyces lydicus]|uniref:amidohydrolase family protein n=1 Tax=Streptomyces lydicus TaxID=47763 RepID=UPI001F3FA31A|nr:amidohydrolase family protein [Streptomyces lydicus]
MAAVHPISKGTSVDRYADLVFLGGRVVTVDAQFSVASALAVTGGVISAVGGRDDVTPFVGPDTRLVDLRGATLLPGINDSHLHGCAFGMATPPLSLDLGHPAVSSLADVAEAVCEAIARVPGGQWITGHGWDTGFLDECVTDPSRQPSRRDLDAVSPDHPVVLYSFSGHATWVNSKALELIGIDRHTVAPPGGAIVVDDAGESSPAPSPPSTTPVSPATPIRAAWRSTASKYSPTASFPTRRPGCTSRTSAAAAVACASAAGPTPSGSPRSTP